MNATPQTQLATFGAGCFWHVEEVFRVLPGVLKTAVGFMGGTVADPSYKQVSGHDTGHAEVVHLSYNPETISYEKLLDVFWENHDPTQVNRQGPDVGAQYRSVVFYHTPEQQKAAEQSKSALEASGKHERPIATAIEQAKTFYKADEEHQRYLSKRGLKTCHP